MKNSSKTHTKKKNLCSPSLKLSGAKNRTDSIRARSDRTIKLESVFADNGVAYVKVLAGVQ